MSILVIKLGVSFSIVTHLCGKNQQCNMRYVTQHRDTSMLMCVILHGAVTARALNNLYDCPPH